MNPEELKYTAENEWLKESDGKIRFGITHFAQDALGDIVFVDLPEVGDTITAGKPCGEVESTKSVSDVYAPVSGEVLARNDALLDTPEMINTDPYGEGWLLDVAMGGDAMDTLDASGYESHTSQI